MKRIFFILILLVINNLVNSQTIGNLSGWVVDKNTQKPIKGVTVKLLNTNYITATDSLGKYQFKAIPTGQYQVTINSLGYLPTNLFNVIVTSGNETSNTIELTTADIILKEVVVGSSKKTVRTATLETPLISKKIASVHQKQPPANVATSIPFSTFI